MSTTKWEYGQALINRDGVRIAFSPVLTGMSQEQYELAGWFVDATAEKRERVLAEGWIKGASIYPCDRCGATMVTFMRKHDRACEACAPSMGVFAPSAPAKPVRPADDDRAAWEALVPRGPIPGAGIESANVGDVVAWFLGERTRGVCEVIRLTEKGVMTRPLGGYGTGNYELYWDGTAMNAVVLFPADAARAKPAEPKPALGPAPAEKAKREWRAPREMVDGVFVAGIAQSLHHEMGCGPRGNLLTNLARELPPARAINVRGVRSIYLPPTESQGEKLSRLVESGRRADVRLDETRFEAGMRGVK